MSNPKDILAQLLSPPQADVLVAYGSEAWAAAAGALGANLAEPLALHSVAARLVMPEETLEQFTAPHLVAPVQVSTDRDQSAVAYVVVDLSPAAQFLDTVSDDENDEERHTVIIASTLLGPALQALNAAFPPSSSTRLEFSLDEVVANAMPAFLGAMDEPALVLDVVVASAATVPLCLVLPGTFLDIVATSLPPAGAQLRAGSAPPAPQAALDAGFASLLTEDDLEAAELRDLPRVEAQAPLRMDRTPEPPPRREPTPISQAPAAARARFTPLPETQPSTTRHSMDLLAGLEMNITVELGRTDLTIAEVLGLGPGSVIELDRVAGEPVDILVNNRLVARGEVVVVDENFGVRVVEVVRRNADAEEQVS
jgi:flagellar motor switch protein FliN/FliY